MRGEGVERGDEGRRRSKRHEWDQKGMRERKKEKKQQGQEYEQGKTEKTTYSV
jgi:hypothetical protein